MLESHSTCNGGKVLCSQLSWTETLRHSPGLLFYSVKAGGLKDVTHSLDGDYKVWKAEWGEELWTHLQQVINCETQTEWQHHAEWTLSVIT